MTFHVGQKVVCVDDSAGLLSGVRILVKGNIYAVLASYQRGERPEVVVDDGTYSAWNASRFRPVTDISFAHEILRKVTRKDRVRA